MAATSNRRTSITFSSDVTGSHVLSAAANTASPAQVQVIRLASGDNTVTVPTGGTTPVAATIVPPSGNTNAITLKGGASDTGIRLHNTDHATLSFHTTVTSFILNAGAQTDIRVYWT